jgi:hypothetical protein
MKERIMARKESMLVPEVTTENRQENDPAGIPTHITLGRVLE